MLTDFRGVRGLRLAVHIGRTYKKLTHIALQDTPTHTTPSTRMSRKDMELSEFVFSCIK